MNNHEIEKLFKTHPNLSSVYAGVFAKDLIPDKIRNRLPAAYIINTGNSSSPGEHWICIYAPLRGYIEYFDSYALRVPNVFKTFMNYCYRRSNISVQGIVSTVCGQYCLYYICMRYVFHKSMKDIIIHLDSLGDRSDEHVNSFVEMFFSLDLDVIDEQFLKERFKI